MSDEEPGLICCRVDEQVCSVLISNQGSGGVRGGPGCQTHEEMHLRHSVTLTQKQAGQAAVHKSSVMEAVKRTAPDPKQHLFFFKNAGGFLIAASEDEITFIDDFTAD